MSKEHDRILMVVSYYENDEESGIKIRSQLSTKELISLVEMVSSVLYAQQDSETNQTDLSIKDDFFDAKQKESNQNKQESNNKNNIYGDPDLLKVDTVLGGTVIDPLKKS